MIQQTFTSVHKYNNYTESVRREAKYPIIQNTHHSSFFVFSFRSSAIEVKFIVGILTASIPDYTVNEETYALT